MKSCEANLELRVLNYQAQLLEHIRHKLDMPYTDDPEVNKGIRVALGYYFRLKIVRPEICPSSPMEYIACLSPDFAHGALVRARELGHLPKHNSKKAKKWGVEPRKSIPQKCENLTFEKSPK